MASCRPSVGEPRRQRGLGRFAERHGPLLVALAQHAQQPPRRVDVVDVEAAQLADPDAGRVEHLDDESVPQRKRIALLCTGIGGGHRVQRLVLTQHGGQRSPRLGHLQTGGRIARQQPTPGRPCREGLHRRGPARQRGASDARGGLGRQPRPQHRQAQAGQLGIGRPLREKLGQRPQVTKVGAAGVV